MPVVATRAQVDYTPEEMYQLVNDVSSYPKYIPFCSETRVFLSEKTRMKAAITMVKGPLRLSFTTENVLDPGRSIAMRLSQGPFRSLRGLWGFREIKEGGCEISFRLEFEFSNALLGMAFGGFFKEVGESMVAAFCRQAKIRYGARTRSLESSEGDQVE